ncbi:MAG TPA: hypothetical protein PLT09_03075 [Deltaproteobacteria bacterium]|nr:hypothetical protein [Deltaproteobacteria bacterium]HPR53980.1 hypothetical protein [Deltaproteobacteria bacterium]HXK46397.1 hypothetical protein [Deltaproteobacteria bacterium]
MPSPDLSGIPREAAETFRPFAEECAARFVASFRSLSVTGSCLTGDYLPGISDINSALVLTRTDVADLDILAAMGGHFRKKRIRAPLVMTEDYIGRSLDVFPIEFLDMKLFHRTVLGEDPFRGLDIQKQPLRLQCEHDLKGKLINLQRGYISCEGRAKDLKGLLVEAFPGYFPLLRAMLYLMQIPKEPPAHKADVLTEAESVFDIPLKGLRDIMTLKTGGTIPHDRASIIALFQDVCRITHDLSAAMDTFPL